MHDETIKRKINIFELYFTLRGRLSKKDFGKYFFVPTIIIAVALVVAMVMMPNPPNTEEGVYSSMPAQVALFSILYLSTMACGKRARDFGWPIWTWLVIFLITILPTQLPYIFPDIRNLVDNYDAIVAKGSLGNAVAFAFWFAKADEGKNEYGAPCKVVLIKGPDKT